MAIGFRITETMSGMHHFVDPARGAPDERAWHFRVTWGSPLLKAARRAITLSPIENPFTGVVSVEGLTPGEVPCEGTLTLDYGHGTLTYALSFEVEGARYELVAEKRDVDLRRPFELAKTHTTAYGAIRDARGELVSRGVLHFDPASMGAFVRSLRLTARS